MFVLHIMHIDISSSRNKKNMFPFKAKGYGDSGVVNVHLGARVILKGYNSPLLLFISICKGQLKNVNHSYFFFAISAQEDGDSSTIFFR